MWSDKLYKADISQSSSGNTTVITGVAGKRIAIDFIIFRVEGTTTIQLKDGSTAYGGAFSCNSGNAVTLENNIRNQDGIITISKGNDFVINSSAAVQVSGFVRYRMLDNN